MFDNHMHIATQQTNESIQIAGAGLAGLSAAIILAKAGYSVVINEAQSCVGYRFQGDLQGLENWTTYQDILDSIHQAGLNTDFAKHPCHSGMAFDAWNIAYEIHSHKPVFYLIERGPGPDTIDTALLNQAISLGVEIRFKNRVESLPETGISATGPSSSQAIATGYHFKTNMQNGFWVICNDHIAPKGYAYLLSLNGKGTIKSCIFSSVKQKQKYADRAVEAFQRLTNLKMIDPKHHGGVVNFSIPAFYDHSYYKKIGEQAGYQDALWGFGMRYAIMSGVMAANYFINNKNYNAETLHNFRKLMQTSLVNRAIYSRLGNKGYRMMLAYLSRSSDVRRILHYHYNPVWWKSLLLPLVGHTRHRE